MRRLRGYGKPEKWRERIRERIKEKIPRARRKEIRRKVGEELSKESFRLAWKKVGKESRITRARADERVFRLKLAAVRETYPTLSDEEQAQIADRATLQRVTNLREAKLRGARFVKHPKTHRWHRAKREKVRGAWRVVPTGKPVSQAYVNRSVGISAYWSRVRATSKALGISIKDARRVDKVLLDVPESRRRAIYERLVDEAIREGRRPRSGRRNVPRKRRR